MFKANNVTTGRIYLSVEKRERGEFLGKPFKWYLISPMK
jgi:CTP synthase (UTP-ammonia lyase)